MDPWQKAIGDYREKLGEKQRNRFDEYRLKLKDEEKEMFYKYCLDLKDNQKRLFLESKPNDILQDVARQEALHKENSKSRAFTRKIEPFLACVEHYGKALDVLSNSSSDMLCPLWGSLRVLLQVLQDYSKYYAKLLQMLERIGDVLPRYCTYSTMFSKHVPLQTALSQLYFYIITFLMDAKKALSKSSFQMSFKIIWKTFDRQFESSLEQFRRYRDLVEDEAKLAMMIESMEERKEAGAERDRMKDERKLAAQSRSNVEDIKESVENQERESKIAALKTWLHARLCYFERDTMTRKRHLHTNEWILHRQEVSSWTQKEEIQILWIHGDPGCGKSYLYGKILDYLELLDQPPLFFLFCDGDGERRTIDSLIRSWTYQMIEKFPDAAQIAIDFQKSNGQSSATTSETMRLFWRLLENSPSCYLTVDGLDECPDRDQFFSLLDQLPKRFKVLIFSRLFPDINAAISQHSERLETLEITSETVEPDIHSYIDKRLQSKLASFDIDVVDKIRQRLSNCHGMFLWVHLMFDQLEAQTTVAEILQCLDEMPDELNEFYHRIFERINRLRKPRRDLAHKVFFWIRVARRPLSVAELTALIAIRIGDETPDKTRFLHDPENIMSSVCSPLVQFRHPGGLAFTRHFSVNQYLDTYFKDNQIFQDIAACYNAKDLSCGESLAAAVCLTYLSMPALASVTIPRRAALETYLEWRSRFPQVNCISGHDEQTIALYDYASLSWFEHLRQIGTLDPKLRDIVMKFFNIRVSNWQAWWHNYAGCYDIGWHSTLQDVSALHIAVYLRLENLIMLQLKDTDLSLRDDKGACPLFWAVRKAHISIVRILLDAGFDPYSKTLSSTTAVHSAAFYGPLEIFEALIFRQKERTETLVDKYGQTPLHRATEARRTDIIERILQDASGVYGTVMSLDKRGWSPLHHCHGEDTMKVLVDALPIGLPTGFLDIRGFVGYYKNTILQRAVAWDNKGIVQKLVAAGANINVFDDWRETPLHTSARFGSKDIVSILLNAGAGINLCNKESKTALYLAAQHGHGDIVAMLVEAGANVNIMDIYRENALSIALKMQHTDSVKILLRGNVNIAINDEGMTALHFAAGYGHTETVRMLLDFGADINRRTKNGDTALRHATYSGKQKIVELLIRSGADVNIPSELGETVLHIAAQHNELDIVKILLRTNISLAHVNQEGHSALFYANARGNYEIVKLLHTRMEELGLTSPETSIEGNIEDSDSDSSREIDKTLMNDSYVLIDTAKEFESGTKDPFVAVHEIPLEGMVSASLELV